MWFFAFVLGLIVGSFGNVVIYRLPRNLSVRKGRSHCPQCNALIPWHNNIPLFSYAYLRGISACCRKPISIEYPLVELCTGILFSLILIRNGPLHLEMFFWFLFGSTLVIITVIDLHHRIIPDELSLGGILVGFLVAWLFGPITWWESIGGIALGGGAFYLVAWLYERMTGREGLGGGDIKLLAMLGAWLGAKSVLPIIVVSTGLGSIIGLIWMYANNKSSKTAIPFGPFLCLAALFYYFFRDTWDYLLYPYF